MISFVRRDDELRTESWREGCQDLVDELACSSSCASPVLKKTHLPDLHPLSSASLRLHRLLHRLQAITSIHLVPMSRMTHQR